VNAYVPVVKRGVSNFIFPPTKDCATHVAPRVQRALHAACFEHACCQQILGASSPTKLRKGRAEGGKRKAQAGAKLELCGCSSRRLGTGSLPEWTGLARVVVEEMKVMFGSKKSLLVPAPWRFRITEAL
jgi:hypothetical protein